MTNWVFFFVTCAAQWRHKARKLNWAKQQGANCNVGVTGWVHNWLQQNYFLLPCWWTGLLKLKPHRRIATELVKEQPHLEKPLEHGKKASSLKCQIKKECSHSASGRTVQETVNSWPTSQNGAWWVDWVETELFSEVIRCQKTNKEKHFFLNK